MVDVIEHNLKKKEMILTEQDTNDLENFANEIPTKYGLPILSWLNGIKERNDTKGKGKK